MIDKLTIIRSNRKTFALQVTADGRVIARAPMKMKKADILSIVSQKEAWITQKLQHFSEQSISCEPVEKFTLDELNDMADKLDAILTERLIHYAALLNVHFGKVTIRNQKTRWGSCSGKGNLNFNCLLALVPSEALDSVVVHELCHLKEMNHSKRFYDEVLSAFPDYYKWDKWLKDNGAALMRRVK